MSALRLQSVVDITPHTLAGASPSQSSVSNATRTALPRLLIPRDDDNNDICVEALVRLRKDGRYQLVLQSGPDQSPAEIHATFLLPPDTYFTDLIDDEDDNASSGKSKAPKIAFQDPYIAVLTNSHSLVLHEVNTTADKTSIWTCEGWTVALPMETEGVWAHPAAGKGWLLQRVAVPPPVLQLPPHVQPAVSDPMRWFSLEQVWEDPLPVRLQVDGGSYDWEEEQLVWIQANGTNQHLALTYHASEHRHTLWTMSEEKHQPSTRPLYEQTRGRQTVSDVSFLWGDLDADDDAPAALTRQEALAQALKVAGPSGSSHKKVAVKRSRPSAAAFPPLAEEAVESLALSPLIHPRWSWKPIGQQVATAAASQAWILTGNDSEMSLLALLVPSNGTNLYEIQYWPLTESAAPSEVIPSRPCRGAQPVKAVPGRTDLLVWSLEDELVLYRSGFEPLLPFQLPGALLNISDAFGSRVSLKFSDGRILRASVAIKSATSWEERLWKLLERSTPLVWAMRLDCVRLQDLLVTKSPDVPSTAALEVVLDVLAELDWRKGQLNPPLANTPEEDSWKILLGSEFHREFSSLFEDSLYLGKNVLATKPETTSWMRRVYMENHPLLVQTWESASHQGSLAVVFDAMHLLWQDSLLYVQQRPLGLLEILVKVTRTVLSVNAADPLAITFADEYVCSGGEMPAVTPMVLDKADIIHAKFTNFEECPTVLGWIDDQLSGRQAKQYYGSVDGVHPALTRTRSICRIFEVLTKPGGTDSSFVETLVEEGIEDSTTLLEDFPTGIAYPLLDVIYRCRNNDSASLSPKAWSLVGREDMSRNLANEKITVPGPPLPESMSSPMHDHHHLEGTGGEDETDAGFGDVDNDGLVPLELRSSMLYPKDNRLHEAARLVRSSRPIFLRVPRSVEVTDHEFEQLKQKKLSLLVQRALALPIGRGMMTIGGIKPVAAEPLPIPELCLKGRVPPSNATLSMDQSECTPEARIWPEFHNGVAAGLRLPLPFECKETMSRVTRSWIVYNRPACTSQENNDDASNRAGDLKSHAHGGFLLALGLRGHLTALEMTDLYEYLTEGTVTTTVGVLLGMAANKRGTCDLAISTMLFLHVPSLIPQHFSAIDVASAVQTAAVTGAGLLFQGSSHRMMTEFLLNEIGKRPESDMSAFDREAYTLACGIALGMVNLCVGNSESAAGLADLQLEARLRRYIEGGEANEDEHRRVRETNDRFSIPLTTNGSDSEKCSIVHEGNLINTDLTSPAATLALGLMYMKTGNRTVASAVDLPNTHFLLEWVRPDFLGLRVLAKALILWDDVVPSNEWVTSQIPSVVKEAYSSMRTIAKKASEGVFVQPVYDFDRRSVRQMYVHVLAGACFAIGVRFAGTGDVRAFGVLCEYIKELYLLREANDPVSIVSKPEFPILETCLGQAAIALALVMAGTGDLSTLRVFKILRWRHDKDIRFGSHMTYGMAVGLLFLGGGTMTLGREPEHIAAIITAFFPRFPSQTGDNQYHLQALRHLYALAVQQREICAVDVDNGTSVHVPVRLGARDGENAECADVPCLRRNTEFPENFLSVSSGQFYPICINLDELNGSAFFVKKRSCVGQDVLSRYNDLQWSRQIESSTTSKFFLTLTKYLDKAKISDPFVRNHVLDSVIDDTEETLSLFFSLAREGRGKQQNHLSCSFLWDLRLIRTYFANNSTEKPLIKRETLALLLERVEKVLVDLASENPHYLRLAAILYRDGLE